ncbi:MAG: hypothetical protein ABSF62_19820 [Bryobacteraceae bacterium]
MQRAEFLVGSKKRGDAMPMKPEEIKACVSCMEESKHEPPCLENNHLATTRGQPLLRVYSLNDRKPVKWPCYFHAHWEELAPALVNQIPPKEGDLSQQPDYSAFHQNDLTIAAYPDRASQQWFPTIQKDTIAYAEGNVNGSSNHRSPARVKVAMSPACAASVGYVTEGSKTSYNRTFALLHASQRGSRLSEWQGALARYHKFLGVLPPWTEAKWAINKSADGNPFITYGGGGAGAGVGFNAGDIVFWTPDNQRAYLGYFGIGPSLSSPKYKSLPASKGSGAPNPFPTKGRMYYNMTVYGSSGIPPMEAFTGFCVFFNAAAATVGGVDATCVLINPTNPTALIEMAGLTTGWNLGAGGYLGYIGRLS